MILESAKNLKLLGQVLWGERGPQEDVGESRLKGQGKAGSRGRDRGIKKILNVVEV